MPRPAVNLVNVDTRTGSGTIVRDTPFVLLSYLRLTQAAPKMVWLSDRQQVLRSENEGSRYLPRRAWRDTAHDRSLGFSR
jgi:hypothetical protein